jgi:D-inositol-3-phosphate glycosyltransferase
MVLADQLRIAMLSAHSCPVGKLGTKDTGGMSVYIRELACELARRGHPVDIYTRVHDPRDRQIYELCRNARLIHLKAGQDEEIHKLAVYSHISDFASNLEAFRKGNRLGYDLIFSHYWLSGVAGRCLQPMWHVPHMIMFHTLGAVKNTVREQVYPVITESEPELRLETEKSLIQDCHRVIAATEKEKEALVRHYEASPDRISVVPCGVNLEQFRVLDKRVARQHLGLGDDRLILCVSRIDPLKGVEKLIKALPHLQSIPGLRLIVIGGGEDSQREVEQLRKLAHNIGVDDAVTFPGLVKHEELPYYYSAADVCVVPSYYESFGLVALESLACGTPVVATDVGNLRSVVRQGETGYVVKENSPHILADRISTVIARFPVDTESALRIRESVIGYGWPRVAEAVIGHCRQVLAEYSASVSG